MGFLSSKKDHMVEYQIVDTETVGLKKPAEASGVVSVAYLKINPVTLEITDEFYSLVNPGCPIEPDAQAIHGISFEAVADKPYLHELFHVKEPTVAIGHNCLTPDHEFLTRQGWRSFSDFRNGETVEAATWFNGSIRFANCLVYKKHYKGKLYSYDSVFHTGRYTEDHRVIFTSAGALLNGGSPKWEVATAGEYAKRHPNGAAVPSSGVYEGHNLVDLTSAEAQLLECARADAHITENSLRWNFSKPRKVARCVALIEHLNLPYSIAEKVRSNGKKVTRISLLDCEVRKKLVALLGEGRSKSFGPWLLNLSLEARRAVLEETKYWDGVCTSQEEDSKAQTVVSSAKQSDLEWLQIAAVCSGYTSTFSGMQPNTRGFSLETSVLGRTTIRNRLQVKTSKPPTVESFEGEVACLNTEDGFFLVRREGKVWVTGNCAFDARFLDDQYDNKVGAYCTLAGARAQYRTAPNHKLQTLADFLGLQRGEAHNALGDCYTTLSLLRRIVQDSGRSLEQLVKAASKPKHVHVMPFGAHKGKKLSDLPLQYIRWFDDREVDPDLRYSFDMQLKLRAA